MIEPAPTLVDRYELGPVIGRGGMAEVRAGRDNRLERPVAVKLLRAELAHQPEVRARFETEARLAARLSHPNVVAVYDSGEVKGVPFIVMERLPGDTLHDRLGAGPMPPDDVSDLAAQVLSALETAHAAGVLHRDIKPGNILAGGPGQWKVGDFGIAKALEGDGADIAADMTATGLLIGTPAYLAPERFFGSPATVASDLYSLAVVLYEALAGTKPFRTSRPDAWASLIAGTDPPPLSGLRPGIDPEFERAVMRGLAKDPADRYWSAGAMAAALAEARAGSHVAVAPGAVAAGSAGPVGSAGTAGPAGGDGDWPPLGAVPSRPATAVPPTAAPPTAAPPTAVLGQGVPATDVLPLSERPYGATERRPYGPGRRPHTDPALRVRVAVAAAIALAVIVGLAVALTGTHHSGPASTTPTTVQPAPGATAPAAGNVPPALGRALHNLLQQVKK